LHTLQGTAGTVGASQLADYALRIQQQLRASGSARAMPFSADEFEALIRHSCSALQAYADALMVQPPSPMKPHTVLNKSAITAILDDLDVLMRARNMRALSAFDELRVAYGPALADRLLALEQTISDLNFPASLECTRTLREALV
jgi:HPt (histidine-containing phosphotransfer) domain-containing protein